MPSRYCRGRQIIARRSPFVNCVIDDAARLMLILAWLTPVFTATAHAEDNGSGDHQFEIILWFPFAKFHTIFYLWFTILN